MLKKLLVVFVASAALNLHATGRFIENEINMVSTVPGGTTPDVTDVALSTSAWTACPAISGVNEYRTLLFVTNYSTNNAAQNYIFSDSTFTPTV